MVKASDIFGTNTGGGTPVNSALPLNTPKELVTLEGGAQWLRTGSTIPKQSALLRHTGDVFDLGSNNIVASGTDGEYFYLCRSGADVVVQFTKDFQETGFSFSVADQEINPRTIICIDQNFWVAGNTNKTFYKYSAAGIYSGESFSVADQVTSTYYGATFDGTNFHVLDDANKSVHIYSVTGVYVTSYDVTGYIKYPRNISFDGENIWIGSLPESFFAPFTTDYIPVAGLAITDDYSMSVQQAFWDGDRLYAVCLVSGSSSRIVLPYAKKIAIEDYPDATLSITNGYPEANYTNGGVFSFPDEANDLTDVAFDGEHFWAVSRSQKTVYQYDRDGSLTGHSFTFLNDYIGGLEWDGEFLCLFDYSTHYIYRFTRDGVSVSYFSTPGLTGGGAQTGLTFNGQFFYIAQDLASFARVHVYSKYGGLLRTIQVEDTVSSPRGIIAVSPDTFLLLDSSDNIHKYVNEVYSGTRFAANNSPIGLETGPRCGVFDGENLWLAGGTNKKITRILLDISYGDPIPRTDTDTGYPLYVRIK